MLETGRAWDDCGGIINLLHQGDNLMISVGEGSGAIRYTLVGNLSLSLAEFSVRGWLTSEIPSGDKSDSPFSRPTSRVELGLVPYESSHDIKFKIEVLESEPPMIEIARSWKECDGGGEIIPWKWWANYLRWTATLYIQGRWLNDRVRQNMHQGVDHPWSYNFGWDAPIWNHSA